MSRLKRKPLFDTWFLFCVVCYSLVWFCFYPPMSSLWHIFHICICTLMYVSTVCCVFFKSIIYLIIFKQHLYGKKITCSRSFKKCSDNYWRNTGGFVLSSSHLVQLLHLFILTSQIFSAVMDCFKLSDLLHLVSLLCGY